MNGALALFQKAGSWAAVSLVMLVGAFFSTVTSAQEVLPVPTAPFKGQIGLSARLKSDFPKPVQAPNGAPNIVLCFWTTSDHDPNTPP